MRTVCPFDVFPPIDLLNILLASAALFPSVSIVSRVRRLRTSDLDACSQSVEAQVYSRIL